MKILCRLDIIVLWAECGPQVVRLTPLLETISTATLCFVLSQHQLMSNPSYLQVFVGYLQYICDIKRAMLSTARFIHDLGVHVTC